MAASEAAARTQPEQDGIRAWWSTFLGAVPDPTGHWRPGPLRTPRAPEARGEVQQLIITSFGTEMVCELLLPPAAAATGIVVVIPFYDTPSVFGEPTPRTRLAGRDPAASAHGLQLAAAGHSVLAVPWWFEQIAAADPATARESSLEARYGPAAERHHREQSRTALGRSIADLMLAVTALEESGLADGMHLTAFGHSLGAKLTLHLAALDPRIRAAAAHEGGLGFAHSNWTAPWYLGDALPGDRDQDELLGLVAPRPFLLAGGGDGDGQHNLDVFRAARRSWPGEEGLDLLLHEGGHPLPRHVMAGIREWLTRTRA